jgi:hypothetical protein
MRELMNAGYEPETVTMFVTSGDSDRAQAHRPREVQLQPPGMVATARLPPRGRWRTTSCTARPAASASVRNVMAYIDSTAVELPPAA